MAKWKGEKDNMTDMSIGQTTNRVASTYRRMGAFLIDYGICIIFFLPASAFSTQTLGGVSISLIWVAVGLIAQFSFKCFFLHFFSATPGKMFFGLKVVNIHAPAQQLGVLQVLIRVLSDHLGLFLSFGPFAWAFLNFERRQLSDYFAETKVIGDFDRKTNRRWIVGPLLVLFFLGASIASNQQTFQRLQVVGTKLVFKEW